jgi:hypothetical protein
MSMMSALDTRTREWRTLYGGLMLKCIRNQSMVLRYFFERLCFMMPQQVSQLRLRSKKGLSEQPQSVQRKQKLSTTLTHNSAISPTATRPRSFTKRRQQQQAAAGSSCRQQKQKQQQQQGDDACGGTCSRASYKQLKKCYNWRAKHAGFCFALQCY